MNLNDSLKYIRAGIVRMVFYIKDVLTKQYKNKKNMYHDSCISINPIDRDILL